MRELGLVGFGRVGKAFKEFWAGNNYELIIADPFEPGVHFHNPILHDKLKLGSVRTAVVCTPGDDNTLIKVIPSLLEKSINVIDVSFHDGDIYELGALAEANDCWYIPDAGFGPGIMNMMVCRTQMRVANTSNPYTTRAYVAGLPIFRDGVWDYASTWNTNDHLAEYTRPARYIENGVIKTVMPLESDMRYVNSPMGTMEAFCSDGLRSLLEDPGVANMAEFTCRWPGFIKKMRLMNATGMLKSEHIGTFAKAIYDSKVWEFKDQDQDFCFLEVVSTNKRRTTHAGMKMVHRRQRIDHSAMSWCTAVGAAAALHIATKHKLSSGLHVIERLVENNIIYGDYLSILNQGSLEINEY